MTLNKRLRVGTASLICFAAISTAAAAETPHALSNTDAEHYVAAFQDVDRGLGGVWQEVVIERVRP